MIEAVIYSFKCGWKQKSSTLKFVWIKLKDLFLVLNLQWCSKGKYLILLKSAYMTLLVWQVYY
jgi:hypothetical protein